MHHTCWDDSLDRVVAYLRVDPFVHNLAFAVEELVAVAGLAAEQPPVDHPRLLDVWNCDHQTLLLEQCR